MVTAVIIIAIVVTVLALVLGLRQLSGRSRLRRVYGPEYDRVVGEHADRREGERVLRERLRWYEELQITEVRPELRRHYAEGWLAAQEQFVEEPAGAVQSADALVTAVLRERRFPVGDPRKTAEALSVGHGDVLPHYRAARGRFGRLHGRDGGSGVSTEELREALLNYRTVFRAVLGDLREDDPSPRSAQSAQSAQSDRAAA